jgi:hypothetical protein
MTLEYRDDRTGQEPDDLPDPPEPELCAAGCMTCGHLFVTPAGEPERFCSMACEHKWEVRERCRVAGPTTDDDGDGVIPF